MARWICEGLCGTAYALLGICARLLCVFVGLEFAEVSERGRAVAAEEKAWKRGLRSVAQERVSGVANAGSGGVVIDGMGGALGRVRRVGRIICGEVFVAVGTLGRQLVARNESA